MSSTFRSNGMRTDGSLRLGQETDDRSLGQIVRDLNVHVRELVNGEVAMAKRELAANARSMAVPIGMAVGAAVFALVCVILLGHTVAWALNNVMDAGLAYLVTAVLFALVAGGLGFAAKKGLERARVAPAKTLGEAKEDVSWIKTHTR